MRRRDSTAAAEAPEDVDAPFERRFEEGECGLRPVESPSVRMTAQSVRPFLDDALTAVGVELDAAGVDLLTADESIAEDAAAGVKVRIFVIAQAESILFIGPPPARRRLLVGVGETG